jgi:hypothetical protein
MLTGEQDADALQGIVGVDHPQQTRPPAQAAR